MEPKYKVINKGPAIGYFIGVIMGDGSICKYKRKIGKAIRYKVQLGVRDKDFSNIYRKCIKNITGIMPNQKIRIRKTIFIKTCHMYTGIVYDVRFYSTDLHNLYKNRNRYINKYYITFLQGIFDAEGCCSKNQTVSFANRDIFVLNLVKKLLKRLNINARITTGGLRLNKQDSITFSKKIGFRINRKQQRLLLNPKYISSKQYNTHEDG